MPLIVLRSKDFADAPRFQQWTDALCFRQMAREATNNYLRSMCVRNAILSAWTTLEMACCDALGITKLEADFKTSLDNEFEKKQIPRLDFGSGLWQEINSKVKGYRKTFAHAGVTFTDRFPSLLLAEYSISKIREAIREIYARVGRSIPKWIDHDESQGWYSGGGITIGTSVMGHATVLHAGANPETPGVVRVVLVTPDGEEKPTRYLPPSTSDEDAFWWVEDYLGKLNFPFKAIRVYRGVDLIQDEDIETR
jgi:hypothetical protein